MPTYNAGGPADSTVLYTLNADGTLSPVTTTAGLPVSIVSGGTGTGAQQVQGTAAAGAALTGNPLRLGGAFVNPTPTLTSGQIGDLQLDARGNLKVSLVDATGTQTTPVSIFGDGSPNSTTAPLTWARALVYNGSTWDRMKKPNAVTRIVSSAATTNATVVKASAGDVFIITGANTNAARRYLKIYNKATAPTVGTDTPVMTLSLPPSADFAFDFPAGMYFGTGIGIALTTGSADSDTGAVGAGDILALNVGYA